MPKLAKDKYCTGCLACMDACRHEAISVILKNGMPYPKVNVDKCVDCKLCEKTCPIVTSVKRNDVSEMLVYGGWATDSDTRFNGASGGSFGGIAQGFFRQKNSPVVFGATLLDDDSVHHVMIDKIEDVPLLMNSKYIQSDTSHVFSKVAQCLRDGHEVLFSGTPCQIAGLYGYLGKKKSMSAKLWTIELVCHGIASKEALDLAKDFHHFNKLYSFRNKINGQVHSQCCTYWKGKKKVTMHRKDDVFCQIFSTWLLDRKSCSNCKFSAIERVADITLGDFWGEARNADDYKLGVNLIIANNNHGNTLLKSSDGIETYESTLLKAINSNPNLYDGFKFVQYHPLVLFPNFFRKVLSKRVRLAILTRKYPWIFFWAPYKILTSWYAKKLKKKIIKKYSIE